MIITHYYLNIVYCKWSHGNELLAYIEMCRWFDGRICTILHSKMYLTLHIIGSGAHNILPIISAHTISQGHDQPLNENDH